MSPTPRLRATRPWYLLGLVLFAALLALPGSARPVHDSGPTVYEGWNDAMPPAPDSAIRCSTPGEYWCCGLTVWETRSSMRDVRVPLLAPVFDVGLARTATQGGPPHAYRRLASDPPAFIVFGNFRS